MWTMWKSRNVGGPRQVSVSILALMLSLGAVGRAADSTVLFLHKYTGEHRREQYTAV